MKETEHLLRARNISGFKRAWEGVWMEYGNGRVDITTRDMREIPFSISF